MREHCALYSRWLFSYSSLVGRCPAGARRVHKQQGIKLMARMRNLLCARFRICRRARSNKQDDLRSHRHSGSVNAPTVRNAPFHP
jgi:hypothetical protein